MGRIGWGLVAVACAILVLNAALGPGESAAAQTCYPGVRRFSIYCEATRTPYYIPTVPLFVTPYQIPTMMPTLVFFTATPVPRPTDTPTILPSLTPSPLPTATATAPPETAPADNDAAAVTGSENAPAPVEPGT
jgi:hypothetical protein